MSWMSQAAYDEMVERDLEYMWRIKRYMKANPGIDSFIKRIVSKYPFQDVVMIVWVLFIVGWIEIGLGHFWVASMNLAAVMGNAS